MTAEEMRVVLGASTLSSPSIPLDRLGVTYRVDGRRGGHKVYKVETAQPAQVSASLDTLLETLGLDPEDNEFWRQRAATLAAAHNIASSVNGDNSAIGPQDEYGQTLQDVLEQRGAVTGRLSPGR